MLKTTAKILMVSLLAVGLFIPAVPDKAEARSKKKVGFFTRVKRTVKHKTKMAAKKTKRAIVNTGCAVSNGIHDSATKAKSAITGKKPKRVWVKGHYKTGNKTCTNGHYRRVKRHHKHSSGGSASVPAPTPAPTPSPVPGI